MAKLLRGASTGLGNISKLPDELLICIISLLEFKEAVRTSILSTRWRYLYASIPNLHFDIEEGEDENLVGFQNVLDKLFDLRSSSRCIVDKFHLGGSAAMDLNPLNVQRWMQSVTLNGVRELDLIIPVTVMVPGSICTCKTLEVLKLTMESRSRVENFPLFEVPDKVCLPSLKFLLLDDLAYADNECVNRLISNCPVLEEFVFHLWDADCKLSVYNTTLTYLSIRYFCSDGCSANFDIVINAPNIEVLRYSVSCATSQTLVFGPALTKVSYDVQVFRDRSLYLRCATDLIRLLKDVEELNISAEVLMNLGEFHIPLPIFEKLRHLTIHLCGFGIRGLPYLLASCESLELIQFKGGCLWNPRPEELIALKEPGVGCLTSHLKAVEFLSFKPEEHQIEAVKCFLESAKVLKTVEIHLCEDVDANSEIVKELPMLPRISKECEVVIYQDEQ